MRLRAVSISRYKNLSDFVIDFEGDDFIDVMVGKNGSGKSNFLEALIEIFDHIFTLSKDHEGPHFDYSISWEVDEQTTQLNWQDRALSVQIGCKTFKTLRKVPLPDNIIVYYSGQNDTVASLVRRYRESYRRSVRRANIANLPRFIGIGPDYKAVLLALMLMLPEETPARQFLCAKLGIVSNGGTVTVKLRRPGKGIVAQKTAHDPFDKDQLFWGVGGAARAFIDRLLDCIVGDFTTGSLYDRETRLYRLDVDVEKFRETFAETAWDDVFCLFNTLRALGMIEDVSIPVRVGDNVEVTSRAFSDGQFQSIYLFAISELFKNRECITLLDEPDAFLHPEWQYDFLNQIHSISEEAARSNHIIMSSHSASTIAAKVDARFRVFESDGKKIVPSAKGKSEIIQSLSAGLINFSEEELKLSIQEALRDTDCPVLFTEGPTDRLILERAWSLLHPGEEMPFAIESGFGRQFLRTLFKDEVFRATHSNRKLFALFDFDEAYRDWKQLGTQISNDPDTCLARAINENHFALLLPVPPVTEVRRQVIQDEDTKASFEGNSRMTIEHLFFDHPDLRPLFRKIANMPGELFEFPKGGKTNFATIAIANLTADDFKHVQPIFDLVASKLVTPEAVPAE